MKKLFGRYEANEEVGGFVFVARHSVSFVYSIHFRMDRRKKRGGLKELLRYFQLAKEIFNDLLKEICEMNVSHSLKTAGKLLFGLIVSSSLPLIFAFIFPNFYYFLFLMVVGVPWMVFWVVSLAEWMDEA